MRKALLPAVAVIPLIAVGAFAVVAAAKASDGAYTIAFASFAPIRTNVFVADGAGGQVRRLLRHADVDYNPSLSHDGNWIIFTSNRSGSADLYRVHLDGSGLERLTDDPGFDDQGVLVPDRQTVAFVSTRGSLQDGFANGPASATASKSPQRRPGA